MAVALPAFRTAIADLPQSPTGEVLSGVFGSISLTAWICLLLPQLIANYKSKSADGLSMAFLFVWLLGDVANLFGALYTNIAPTAIALAFYFCLSDTVLIAQSTYYNTINARRRRRGSVDVHRHHQRRHSSSATADTAGAESDHTEDSPLLSSRRRRSSSVGLPGSHRRHVVRTQESGFDPLRRIVTGEDDSPDSNPWLHNTFSLVAVYVVGTAGWYVSWRFGAWGDGTADPGVPDGDSAGAESTAILGVALGYFSALCYLCARIPQIYKNYREKSCEGLALLFFLLSLTGNLTYGASLVSFSQSRDYLIKALPWLLGSLGTIVEDVIIFVQFRLYAVPRQPKVNGVHE